MSAIFGLVSLDGQPIAETDPALMDAALAPFGPDGGGIWTASHVALGQRLMRFTPEDCFEHQPVRSRDGQRVLVSDARIDNRPELVEELAIPPAQAREMADSGLMLRAYEKWGADCASHLIGAYAFALCDVRERSVFLARSAMGERSLFYFETSRLLAFASAPKGLFALPFVPREVNRQNIADFLVFAAGEPGTSYFSGINRLQAGHSMLVREGRIACRRFRGIDTGREIRFSRDGDYVDAFNALFDRVAADQLRSLTPVGVWLSGGLDSTTIAASAAARLKREGKRLHTFTAVPPADFRGTLAKGWYADETPLVHAMARRYENLDTHFIVPDGRFYLDNLAAFFAAGEAPLLGAAHLNWVMALQQEAGRQNARVLLTGIPGNFTISYDGESLMAQRVREWKWKQAFCLARDWTEPRTIPAAMRRTVSLGLMPLLPNPLWMAAKQLREGTIPGVTARPYWWKASPLNPEFARAQKLEERVRSIVHYFRPGAGPADRVAAMLWRADRRADTRRGEEVQYGVQNRDLPADIRLVEFCLSIPGDQYLGGGTSRWLIRRAGADRLPVEVRENRMRGFQSPDWFESMKAARSRISEELTMLERSGLASEMIDLTRLRRLADQIPSGQGGDRTSWSLLHSYRWVFELGITTGRFLRWVESGA
jgi:asparagine synthase (glutamine-hydrolysing)